jgi:nucleoside-diphosphate-sugar epimerase
MFGGQSLLDVFRHPRFAFSRGDVRNQQEVTAALQGCDAVCHLAAIVGDPACRQHEALAWEVNLEASERLFRASAEAGVERFVFASTCSNYGRMADPEVPVSEESPLAPVSIYAETKVRFERLLLASEAATAATCLRFATVYGLSPRLRFDLTVNEFTRELHQGRKLLVFGEQFWRPYCHVQDLARSMRAVLEAPRDVVCGRVFNVGDTSENYTKKMLVDAILRQIPAGEVEYVEREDDPRDYRVDFTRIREELSFDITMRVPDGIREVRALLDAGLLSDPFAAHFRNVA